MTVTIDYIAKNPTLFYHAIVGQDNEKYLLRPLEKSDESSLLELLTSLSQQTRVFYSYNQPLEAVAKEMIEAINKYDKVRFILEYEKHIIGLFEFSMDIPENDVVRFQNYGIQLSAKTDCRLAPLLSDRYQSRGVGTTVLPILVNIARDFDRTRIILWGGVLQNNPQAIRFYEKNGFKKLGEFLNQDQLPSYDMILELGSAHTS